jgi:hypothetical protein
MFNRQVLLRLPVPYAWVCGTLAAMSFAVCAAQGAEPASSSAADLEQSRASLMQLAAKIASPAETRYKDPKWGLVSSYENVYGSITRVPIKWPTLVRRVLVCQDVEDKDCVQSSMEAINKLGGIKTFPLTHLFEVSRFRMPVGTIVARIQNTAQMTGSKPDPHSSAAVPPAIDKKDPPASALAENSAVAATITVTAARPAAKAVATKAAAAKAVSVKTLSQKATAKLGKFGAADQSGFFLDALLIAVVIALLLVYFLFSAIRARNIERNDRLCALQEIQRLESLRAEEKLQTDHALWSEQLRAEVSIEAQKAHAEELLRMAQLAAEEALKAEQLRVEQIIQAERLKTEDAIRTAKSNADQAIDAYDQMAARELIYAHKQNDEMLEALNAEKERREAQELKTEEALQAAEALRLNEARLLEAIRTEQRARAEESRQAAEKLKAAQQAAAALQASLAATRASKFELERRLDERRRATD